MPLTERQQKILKRSQQGVYGNYEDAVDSDISKLRSKYTKAVDQFRASTGINIFPTKLSNCALTATQWINPNSPIMRCQTIIDNPNQYGYVEIPESHIAVGDLVIASNPNNGSDHAMLIHDFTKSQQNHTFQGKNYVLPADHPLVRYSRGSTNPSAYRKSVGLMEYVDNSEGKTKLRYYRHYKPGEHEILLPEIVATPHGNYIPSGQKIIKVS